MALFVTHAMIKDTPLSTMQMDNCRKITKENHLSGVYSCRGVLSERVAMHMIDSEDKKMQQFGKMRDQTIGHPNENDVNNVKRVAENLIEDFISNSL